MQQQIADGRPLIHNAPRPLMGDVTEDSWNLPFISGKHYAATSPDRGRLDYILDFNSRMDAREITWVSEEQAIAIGKAYYEERYSDEDLSDFEQQELDAMYLAWAVEKYHEDAR